MKNLKGILTFVSAIMLTYIVFTTFVSIMFPVSWDELIVMPGWNVLCMLSGILFGAMTVDDVLADK